MYGRNAQRTVLGDSESTAGRFGRIEMKRATRSTAFRVQESKERCMRMKVKGMSALGLLVCGAALTISAMAQMDAGVPHLQKQGPATQLIVDGETFLALRGNGFPSTTQGSK